MKRILCLVLAAMMLVSVVACGEKNPPVTDGTSAPTVTNGGDKPAKQDQREARPSGHCQKPGK